MENKVVKDELVNRLVYLSEESFYFLSRHCEILMDHLFKIGSFLDIRVDILRNNVPYLLDSQHSMRSFVLFMKTDASFGLADASLVGAGEARAHLNGRYVMNVAYDSFIFGVP